MLTLFYDLETTGLKVDRHGIHQLSGILVEGEDQVVKEFNWRMRPAEGVELDPSALAIGGLTAEDLKGFRPQREVYQEFIKLLDSKVDRFNRRDKIYLAGFNNRAFDDIFLRRWFENNGNSYFGSYFWPDTLDVLVLAGQYLKGPRRARMSSFKLSVVASELGIKVDEKGLHEAGYDVKLTRAIYQVVTGVVKEEIF